MKTINVFWFRRDLRLADNHGLYQASLSSTPVLPIFIFDKNILNQLEDKADKRVDYIHQALQKLDQDLSQWGGGISSFNAEPLQVFEQLVKEYTIKTVYFNKDFEPYALQRDAAVISFLERRGIQVKQYKDQVIFEPKEILKSDDTPYTVYTPYSKKWKLALEDRHADAYQIKECTCIPPNRPLHSLEEIGFAKTNLHYKAPTIDIGLLKEYAEKRNIPSLDATSRLGIALRFGTISVRECVRIAAAHSEVWLNELIWREFFMQILFHYPSVVQHAFRAKYDMIEWRNNEQEFEQWCKGETGYLIVDAGMRELNETGFMHNRVRMVVASFLTKHLLIDWRWGEAYFASKLLDYELSSNNGNWQWAAGTGCDAAPYFRIFNPLEQQKKFDPQMIYIKKWLGDPVVHQMKYPPIVVHELARKRALERYKAVL